jgi:hypothetical protein
VTDQTTPSIDVAGLLEGVLAALFGVAARVSPPTLVHPVLGHVETTVRGLWPALTQTTASTEPTTPARLLTPRGLRGFLIGAGATSQPMGKLSMLGLPIDPLQESWSPDGATIGEISVQVVDDASAEPEGALAAPASRLSLTTSAVDAIWKLDPLAIDDDTGAALAAAYSDLMTAALVTRVDTAEFQGAAAGRPLDDLLAEGRHYLAKTASTWLTMVLGLVRLRAAQQADASAADYVMELNATVAAYNQTKATPSASPFETYLAEEFLASHSSILPLPDAEGSVDGGHFTDVLRSAVRYTHAGSPINEDGGPDHPPDAGTNPGSPSDPIVASAVALAGQLRTYTTDPVERWESDKGDSSSFVQRALLGAGITVFDPGPSHLNVWNTYAFATRDNVFVTVPATAARPGDVLVQGGYRTVSGNVTWQGHCGIFTQKSARNPALLEGISMDRQGPTLSGVWGADPPEGNYDFGANIIVRRIRPDEDLIQEIAQHLVIEAGLGIDPDRDALEARAASTLRQALEAQGSGGVLQPIAGVAITPASLAANIRIALNLDSRTPVTWDHVVALLKEILQESDPFSGFKTIEQMHRMSDQLRPTLGATDPDEDGVDLAALASQLQTEALSDTSVPPPSLTSGTLLPPGPPPMGTGIIVPSPQIRSALRAGRRFFSKILTPSTQETGNIVEVIIQADYVLQHPGHEVLIDLDIWNSVLSKWTPLGGTPQLDQIKNLLTSPATSRQFKPDICDLTSREIFEIKPFRKVFLGLAQLYIRYLVPLNVGLYGFTLAKAILESINAAGQVTISVPTTVKPFLPGVDFKSPRWYPMPDGSWAFVMLVAPGVIGYQLTSEIGKDAYEPATVTKQRDAIKDAMAAMIAAAAAAAGARNVSGRPFTPDDLPDLFVPAPSGTSAGDARILLAIAVGLLLVGIIAANVASGGGAAPATLPIFRALPMLPIFG